MSWERVVSGLGIQNIYAFLRDVVKIEEPAWLREQMAAEDPNAVIGPLRRGWVKRAVPRDDADVRGGLRRGGGKHCAEGAGDGRDLFLGGGIAPKILKALASGSFIQAFLDKGRLSPLLESIPVRVILDESCALLGAAAYAEARAAEITGHSERAATVRG